MPTDENQRRTFDFFREHFQSHRPFSKEDLRRITTWTSASFKTYWSKQFEEFLVRSTRDNKYRVTEAFRPFLTWKKFQKHVTQVRRVSSDYTFLAHDSIIIFEFFMPLANEGHLRTSLDALFYRHTILARLRAIEPSTLESYFPRNKAEADGDYQHRVTEWISERFGGYSIRHENGRFRARPVVSIQEAARIQHDGNRYLIDETTAVVRFIFPCGKPSRRPPPLASEAFEAEPTESGNARDVEDEARRIRWVFNVLFVQSIVQVINGEDEIWMVESGMRHRLHIWRVESPDDVLTHTSPVPSASNGKGGRIALKTRVRSSSATSNGASPMLDLDLDPRPFLKWAGGKRQLLTEITQRLPGSYGTYYEPFLGGGALFFHLRPPAAVLADQNERLIRTYCGIKDSVEEVISILKSYKDEKNRKRFFLRLRKQPIDRGTDAEVAAWFIFLNKVGFNGLYRVNSRNGFNVPYGDNKRAQICDEDNLRACSRALAHASITHGDFAAAVKSAHAGDLVYFDPPYFPLSETSYFTAYTADRFHEADQIRLRDVALELKERGVFVILSNSSASKVTDLYKSFKCVPVFASRAVNSKASGRGKIAEMLILSQT